MYRKIRYDGLKIFWFLGWTKPDLYILVPLRCENQAIRHRQGRGCLWRQWWRARGSVLRTSTHEMQYLRHMRTRVWIRSGQLSRDSQPYRFIFKSIFNVGSMEKTFLESCFNDGIRLPLLFIWENHGRLRIPDIYSSLPSFSIYIFSSFFKLLVSQVLHG